jgi:uncharacterized protein
MIFEKEGKKLSKEEFEKITGAKWIPQLDFEDFHIFSDIAKDALKLHKKGEMTLEQLWLGRYYKQEILSCHMPEVAIRWIDPILGWGVFALRDFKKMQFVAEYTGKVRKRKKTDVKNAYCFEYVVVQGIASPYTIDALDQGGVGRYLNHSSSPNLNSSLATFENISHVILYAKEPIAKGTQLCYDYGPDYWSKRTAPISL